VADDNTAIPTERFTPEPNAAGAPQQTPALTINGQYIKDLSFEAPNTPQIYTVLSSEQPKISVDIDVQAEPKSETMVEVVLRVRAEAKARDQLAYLLEMQYAGLFTINVPQEHVGPVVLIECPLILFPFLRRIVADITGDGGFAPLMLSPIDFASLYQQRVRAAQAAQQQPTQTA